MNNVVGWVTVVAALAVMANCAVDKGGFDFESQAGAGGMSGASGALSSGTSGSLSGAAGTAGGQGTGGFGGMALPFNPCSAAPCKNGGVCESTEKGFSCFCPTGMSGPTCEERTSDPQSSNDTGQCAPNPCEHAGTCKAQGDSFSCECVEGYEGDTCEVDTDDCASEPCANDGECSDRLDGYVCKCAEGFSGDRCERTVAGCADEPCLNAGTCTDAAGTYTCDCQDGFDGKNCENDIDDCADQPCQNGAACTDGTNDFTCTCSTGFSGSTCSTDIDECDDEPCKNGGTCTDQPGGYECSCPKEWTGPTCESDVNECSTQGACASGQTCRNFPGTYGCPCPTGYTGTDCELKVFEWLTPVSADWLSCVAFDVSDDGKVAIGNCDTSGGQRAFRWTPTEGMQSLGTLGDENQAWAVSGDGKVIVGAYTVDDQDHSFRWTAQSSMQPLEALPGEVGSRATDTNKDGSVVVGVSHEPDGTEVAFRWTASASSDLGTPSTSTRTVAESVSENGATIVGFGAGVGAWKWTAGTGIVGLAKPPPGAANSATGISPDGKFIVGTGYANSRYYGIFWSGSSVVEIAGLDSQGGRVSNTGAVAGGKYVWDEANGLRSVADALSASGAVFGSDIPEYAYNVSADGKNWVGGLDKAWIARLPSGLK